jgi:hypothetical protein
MLWLTLVMPRMLVLVLLLLLWAVVLLILHLLWLAGAFYTLSQCLRQCQYQCHPYSHGPR